ncbi:beta-galactosidase [Streptomyces lunaelactis]|uniref:glycoside hydrolase family 35 protein n=1 Tax=Streptomyces lunaelactis TaxID=1535768 RepID=UPI0015855C41|nr:beta-galactosidase family protein [Streptomyces lunaelactis]NUK45283.1 beta-galactosidase [Streptomyces lunaelactis]NUK92568.1 beta-galactosidase [Streptomyces lunaelactis]NUL10995.1 beta-galactosidase [Streptomyces lunaelactis]NUL22129.1 beta-galactosidase [Streptomyces lunaelactis]NUL31248.1 beta-galactosidase [Streptomyces lunaelactis]
MAEFTVGDADFLLDGRPVRLLSGALHYFRVHEEQWDHRLAMLRAMGLNCVETYVPWNMHEPEPGRYADDAALGRFLDAAHRAGLWAIVRPGPYICAEWENGGLPHWLTGRLGLRVRTEDPEYLGHVERWFTRLLPQVAERQIGRGGPVIMVQVENEYGSYGTDQGYLRHLVDLLRGCGVTVPLFTSDGPEDHMLTGGSVPGVLATANFGSGAREGFKTLRRHQPAGPLMCMEFWCGWFDHWGADHVVRDPADAAATLREILECGASVNIYMAHGGTNFAGWSGANRGGGDLHMGELQPDVTSYDYGAPVDEFGRPTRKFWLFRDVLALYQEGPLPELPPAPAPFGAPVQVELTEWAPLGDVLDVLGGTEAETPVPPSFEELDVDRGLVRYRVGIPGPRKPRPLSVAGLRDRAVVYVDGVRAGVLSGEHAVLAEPVAGPAAVELWVESLGRVNYGPLMGETKGITGGVMHERQYLHGVRSRGLRLDAFDEAGAVAKVPFRAPAGDGAAATGLYRAGFAVAVPGDAELELPGWTRGFVWVNGFNLGRYWSAGPQHTLYVPGPVLREGTNEVWVLELEAAGTSVCLG